MKKHLYLAVLLLMSIMSYSQQISTSVGRISTTFDYSNSDGNEIENLHSVNGFHYSLGYRMTLNERFYLNASMVFNNYANEGSDPELDNYYRWNTKYLGLSASAAYEFLQASNFRLSAILDVSPQFMISGQQTINNQIFSLKGIEQFDSPFLFLRGGLRANYCLDEKVAISLSYCYGAGSPFKKSGDGEELKLRSSTISLGLLWSIKKCKYCQIRRTNR
ncbi:MAG: outer membrane beta-barrel protein [Flavobacteriales bacterium]